MTSLMHYVWKHKTHVLSTYEIHEDGFFLNLLQSPAEGAQPVLFCALDGSVQTGGYYMDCALYDHTMWVPKCVYDTGLAKKLWKTTERILSECR